jgi:hypothetical protein
MKKERRGVEEMEGRDSETKLLVAAGLPFKSFVGHVIVLRL